MTGLAIAIPRVHAPSVKGKRISLDARDWRIGKASALPLPRRNFKAPSVKMHRSPWRLRSFFLLGYFSPLAGDAHGATTEDCKKK